MDEKDKGQSSSNSSSGRLSPTTLLAQRLLKLAAEEPPVAGINYIPLNMGFALVIYYPYFFLVY